MNPHQYEITFPSNGCSEASAVREIMASIKLRGRKVPEEFSITLKVVCEIPCWVFEYD
jgi:hypothetical protein